MGTGLLLPSPSLPIGSVKVTHLKKNYAAGGARMGGKGWTGGEKAQLRAGQTQKEAGKGSEGKEASRSTQRSNGRCRKTVG